MNTNWLQSMGIRSSAPLAGAPTLRCSCGGLFYSHADFNRHRDEQPHCPDCGGQLVTRSDRDAGICRRCEHKRAHEGCGQ